MAKEKQHHPPKKVLWGICIALLFIILMVIVILFASGVFHQTRDKQPSNTGTAISVPEEIKNQKTGGEMKYSYDLQEKSLSVTVKGNVEVPFCFPFLPNADPTQQSLSFIAFNCFDYSPAIILSFSPIIRSGKIDTVHFAGSMTWDPITYRFQVDGDRLVTQCQVEQNGNTTILIFDYDSNGHLLSVNDKTGYTFDVLYDTNNKISKLNILNRSTAIENNLAFNSEGEITRLTYRGIKTGKTIVAEYTYHPNGMIRTEDVLHIQSRFSYNVSGLLTHPKYNRNSLTISYTKI